MEEESVALPIIVVDKDPVGKANAVLPTIVLAEVVNVAPLMIVQVAEANAVPHILVQALNRI